MVTEIIMPKMGQTMEKGKIVKWLKKVGEEVKKGDSILEIETDKTTIEVEARGSGILSNILAQEGEEVSISTIIGFITKKGEKIPILEETDLEPKEENYIRKAEIDAEIKSKQELGKGKRLRISPLARKIAEEKKVELSNVKGSGPGGRITKDDVVKYLASKQSLPLKTDKKISLQEFTVFPISSMRKAIAAKMSESKTNVPHFYISSQVDMTEAVKMRENLLSVFEEKLGVRLSFTHIIVKAASLALEEHSRINATFEEGVIKIWKDINIGVAVGLKEGLIVPILRNADKLNLLEIASKATKLVNKAQEKNLKEEEFSGGTFTISNMGSWDVESFMAIINIPETAILGVGRISDKPTVVNGQITIRKIMTLTLSVDHRVVDGVVAAQFLQSIKKLLEAPQTLALPI